MHQTQALLQFLFKHILISLLLLYGCNTFSEKVVQYASVESQAFLKYIIAGVLSYYSSFLFPVSEKCTDQ